MADEVKINDSELESVQGGAGNWSDYAKGKYVANGKNIVYTVASGDVLSGIAVRFGVTVADIQKWNNIKNPDMIFAGQKLTITPKVLN